VKLRCILMDIEGTIVPIAFVRDVLFPYAKERLATFLHEHRDDQDVRHWILLCQDTIAQEQGSWPNDDSLVAILHRWMAQDRKHTGLKGVQGMIWEEGYRKGAFAPELYEDVIDALLMWRANGLQLALYSSGSEQAQRLLFSHTTKGDVTGFFGHFFDTAVGPKTDAASYRRIAERLALPPSSILFLSDAEPELDAATAAGFGCIQIVRPGTQAGTHHPIASDFRDIIRNNPASSATRRNPTHAV